MKSCLYFLILLVSCKQELKLSEKDVSYVDSLTSDTQKCEFLEGIYQLDQKMRNDRVETELQFGYNSAQVAQVIQDINATDKLNLEKIEWYLEKYGHPTIQKHGKIASRAPWIVVHHSGNIESRERNFKYLYKAYKIGDLKPGSFSFYLGRLYKMRYGKRFKLPNPYREKHLIDSLINRLELVVDLE